MAREKRISHKLHRSYKESVARRIRAWGHSVEVIDESALGYDFLVDGTKRIRLRVSNPHERRHRVIVAGRSYAYTYRTWFFNFHQHGHLRPDACDAYFCLVLQATRKRREGDFFLIPTSAVTAKTFALHASKGVYQGRFACYRNNRSALAEPSLISA